LGKRGTKKYKEKESAVLYVQRIFVGKMCPNGHIVRKKSEQALFRQYAPTNRQESTQLFLHLFYLLPNLAVLLRKIANLPTSQI
jgi:hypothetical protein